jgi:hypothetical protein
MEVYRYEAEDGLEHLIEVIAEDEEGDLRCETVHRLGALEYRAGQSLNKCLFEEIVGLGLIIPA